MAGKIILTNSGMRGLLPSGKAGITDADGECSECCGCDTVSNVKVCWPSLASQIIPCGGTAPQEIKWYIQVQSMVNGVVIYDGLLAIDYTETHVRWIGSSPPGTIVNYYTSDASYFPCAAHVQTFGRGNAVNMAWPTFLSGGIIEWLSTGIPYSVEWGSVLYGV
jgi:hypothetical protein